MDLTPPEIKIKIFLSQFDKNLNNVQSLCATNKDFFDICIKYNEEIEQKFIEELKEFQLPIFRLNKLTESEMKNVEKNKEKIKQHILNILEYFKFFTYIKTKQLPAIYSNISYRKIDSSYLQNDSLYWEFENLHTSKKVYLHQMYYEYCYFGFCPSLLTEEYNELNNIKEGYFPGGFSKIWRDYRIDIFNIQSPNKNLTNWEFVCDIELQNKPLSYLFSICKIYELNFKNDDYFAYYKIQYLDFISKKEKEQKLISLKEKYCLMITKNLDKILDFTYNPKKYKNPYVYQYHNYIYLNWVNLLEAITPLYEEFKKLIKNKN